MNSKAKGSRSRRKRSKASARGKASDRKGKAIERAAAHALTNALGVEHTRTSQHHGGPDSPDLRAPYPVHWEAKGRHRIALIYDAIEQAERDAKDGDVPAAIVKADRKGFLVVVRVEDLRRFADALPSPWRCSQVQPNGGQIRQMEMKAIGVAAADVTVSEEMA